MCAAKKSEVCRGYSELMTSTMSHDLWLCALVCEPVVRYPVAVPTGGSHAERTCGACIGGARSAFAAAWKI